MIRDVDLQELYRGKANLWVEDPITRTYLKECWSDDPDVFFLIAGGNENVAPILKDAEERGYANVVGLVDRDFGTSNRASWLDPAKGFRRFVPTAHEIENYFLDPIALAGSVTNTAGQAAAAIEQRLQMRARVLTWWMACRSVIMGLRQEFRDGFLEHPKCPNVTDLPTAERWIVDQPWYRNLAARVSAATAPGEIVNRLNVAHASALIQLADGSWQREFSGKELLRDIRSWIYTAPKRASSSELDGDVTRGVAQWQVTNGAVPAEIVELRQAIRQKVGL